MKNKGTNRLQIIAGISLFTGIAVLCLFGLCCRVIITNHEASGAFVATEKTEESPLVKDLYFEDISWATITMVDDPFVSNETVIPNFIYSKNGINDDFSCALINYMLFSLETGEEIPWENSNMPKEQWYPEKPIITISNTDIVQIDPLWGRIKPLREGEATLTLEYGGISTMVPITVIAADSTKKDTVEDVSLWYDDEVVVENIFYNPQTTNGNTSCLYLELNVKFAGVEQWAAYPSTNDVAKVYVEDESIALIESGNIWPYELYTRKGGKTNMIVEIYGQKFTFPLEVKDNKLEGLRLELLEFGQDDTVKVEHVGKHAQLEIAAGDSQSFRLYAQMSDGSEIELQLCDFVVYRSSDREIAEASIYGSINARQVGEARITIEVLDQKITLDVTVK